MSENSLLDQKMPVLHVLYLIGSVGSKMPPFAVTGDNDTKVLMAGHDLKIFLEEGYFDPRTLGSRE